MLYLESLLSFDAESDMDKVRIILFKQSIYYWNQIWT